MSIYYDLGQVVGPPGPAGSKGLWPSSQPPNPAGAGSPYWIFLLEDLGGTPSVGDVVLYGEYYYTVTSVQFNLVYTDNPVSIRGADGVSPVITGAKSGRVTTLTIVDRDHPSGAALATINDGEDNAADVDTVAKELIEATGTGFLPGDFETGNIAISSTGWIYSASSSRVRTKEGTTIHLTAGDVMGFTSYENARFYLGWRDGEGVYRAKGWMTSDFTVTQEGDYVILLCNLVDTTLVNKNELLDLFFIRRKVAARKSAYDLPCFYTGAIRIHAHMGTVDQDASSDLIAEGLVAFEEAGKKRAFICEADIRQTADGYLVCMHNGTVDATTDGTGAVASLTLAEIRALRLKRRDGTVSDQQVPTIDEYLEVCKKYGMIAAMELKAVRTAGFTAKVAAKVREYGMEGQAFFISQVSNAAGYVRNASDLPLMLIVLDSNWEDSFAYAQANDNIIFTFAKTATTNMQEKINACHAIGVPCNIHVVDQKSEAEACFDMGVDIITSNRLTANDWREPGAKGDKGDKGDTGPIGLPGPQGSRGADGVSPVITGNKVGKTTTLTIVDRDHPSGATLATINDGGDVSSLYALPFFASGRIPLQAHRGLFSTSPTGGPPEESIGAFELAGKGGIRFCEADIRLTADGLPICLHDATLNRTTTGTGNANALTLAELRELRLKWPDGTVSEELIPTLDEYLYICKKYGMIAVIELKEVRVAGFMDAVLAKINECGMMDQCLLISQVANIDRVRAKTDLPVLLITLDSNWNDTYAYLQSDQCKLIGLTMDKSPNLTTDIPAKIAACHQLGVPCEVYTCNTKAEADYYFSLGADIVNTDILTESDWLGGDAAQGVYFEVGVEKWYGTYAEDGVTYQVYSKIVKIDALPSTAGTTNYPHGITGIKQILSVYGFCTNGMVMNAPRQNLQDNICIYQVQKSGNIAIEVGKDRSSFGGYVCLVYAKNN